MLFRNNKKRMEDTKTTIVTDATASTTTPTETVASTVVSEPVVTTPTETVSTTPVTEDRSAYNCPDCKGEGLKVGSLGELVNCTNCNNTGKV